MSKSKKRRVSLDRATRSILGLAAGNSVAAGGKRRVPATRAPAAERAERTVIKPQPGRFAHLAGPVSRAARTAQKADTCADGWDAAFQRAGVQADPENSAQCARAVRPADAKGIRAGWDAAFQRLGITSKPKG